MKNFARKAAAVLLSGVFVLTTAGCSSTTWIAKSKGVTYPAGLYLMQTMTKAGEAAELVEDKTASPYTQTIDGIPTTQWIDEHSQQAIKKQIAVIQKFDEMGLSFTEEEQTSLNQMVDMYWSVYQSSYESNGISKKSYALSMEIGQKDGKVFEALYGKGGEFEVPEADMKAIYDENIISASQLKIDLKKKADDGEKVADEEAKKLADEAYERAMKGEDFYTIITDVEKATSEDGKAEEHPTGKEHDVLVDKRTSTMEAETLKKLVEAAPGEIVMFEDENQMVIFKKRDAVGDKELFEQMKPTLLAEMKGEEYNQKVNEWAETVEVEFNQKSLKRYSAEKLFASNVQ